MTVDAQDALTLGNRFARELPEMAVAWRAEEFPDARPVVVNEQLARDLGLDPGLLQSPDGVALLTGASLPESASPVAQAYAGHQFGGYSPRLGDGRALLLGEIVDAEGALRDLHLKGSGRTPFSRGGDGLAALGPMLREYIISEAMHALRVPTTRSLAVVATGRPVHRETVLPGALLARVASSHLRVGSFQYASATGDLGLLRRLITHAIDRHYPHLADAENPALALLDAVIAVQASLIARWMLVGFIHGVMNTDNMTISGETIDYGPCAFMDSFDPATVYSSIDSTGRYAFGNQPLAGEWNLARFAEALLPALDDEQDRSIELAQTSLGAFRSLYNAEWMAGMLAKLGLRADHDEAVTEPLIADLLGLLKNGSVDYTTFFRRLSDGARGKVDGVAGLFPDPTEIVAWTGRWTALEPDADAMDDVNPVYIPRNHLVEEALAAAAADDLGPFDRLMDAVSSPFRPRPGLERYADPAPETFGAYRTFCGT